MVKPTAKQLAAQKLKPPAKGGEIGGGAAQAVNPPEKPAPPAQKAVSLVGVHLQSARNLAKSGMKLLTRVRYVFQNVYLVSCFLYD